MISRRFTDKTIVYSFFIIIFAVRENKLFCPSLNKIIMEQILVTIDDTQSLASVRNVIKMLRGLVSTSITNNVSKPTEEEKQKAYVLPNMEMLAL